MIQHSCSLNGQKLILTGIPGGPWRIASETKESKIWQSQ